MRGYTRRLRNACSGSIGLLPLWLGERISSELVSSGLAVDWIIALGFGLIDEIYESSRTTSQTVGEVVK